MSDNEQPKETKENRTVNVMELPTVTCKCDNILWQEAKILKKLTINEEKKEYKHVIVDVVVCTRCHSILSDGIPIIRLKMGGE